MFDAVCPAPLLLVLILQTLPQGTTHNRIHRNRYIHRGYCVIPVVFQKTLQKYPGIFCDNIVLPEINIHQCAKAHAVR